MKNLVSKVLNRVVAPIKEKRYLEQFYAGTRSRQLHAPTSKGRVLMYVGIGHMYLTPLEILMYHILTEEGYEVDYYIYDEQIPANEVITKQVIETKGKAKFWNKSVADARRVLRASNVRYQHIHKHESIDGLLAPLKGELDKILSFKYEGIDFGDIVKGVLYRYYKSLQFERDAAEVAYRFLETSLTNYFMVKQLHDQNRYKSVFFSHGIYCTWEPVVNYCKMNHLRFICYDRAKMAGSCNFNVNQPSPDWSFNEAWDRYEGVDLSREEDEWVSKYLSERELQKGDVYAYNQSEKAKDIQALKQQLGIAGDKKVITIFTNLIWDAANVSRDIAFDSAFDCIVKTIERYRSRPDIQVVIRSHPAEKVLGTRERYGTLVRQYFKDALPEMVTIIEPEQNVNSFSVIEMSDIGVVNTSTVGLEFAIQGKPILLISDTNYRNKGFTYDVESAEGYFELIDRLLQASTLLPNQVQRARKYFYMMMFLYQKVMPLNYNKGRFSSYQYPSFEQRDQGDLLHRMLKDFQKNEIKDFIYWQKKDIQ